MLVVIVSEARRKRASIAMQFSYAMMPARQTHSTIIITIELKLHKRLECAVLKFKLRSTVLYSSAALLISSFNTLKIICRPKIETHTR